jgi:hypothetical protein
MVPTGFNMKNEARCCAMMFINHYSYQSVTPVDHDTAIIYVAKGMKEVAVCTNHVIMSSAGYRIKVGHTFNF